MNQQMEGFGEKKCNIWVCAKSVPHRPPKEKMAISKKKREREREIRRMEETHGETSNDQLVLGQKNLKTIGEPKVNLKN